MYAEGDMGRGTFCVVVEQQLIISRCPLPAGSCAWQHRITGFCKYTDRDIGVSELAGLVGAPNPLAEEIKQVETKLVATIKAAIQ